jgi:hypothetical protein
VDGGGRTAVRESRGGGDWRLARLWVEALPESCKDGPLAKEEGEGAPNTGRASGRGTTEAPPLPRVVEGTVVVVDRKTREVRGGAPLFRHPMAERTRDPSLPFITKYT